MGASFQDVAEFVANFCGADSSSIHPGTRLEADLGITGDDGVDLLAAFAERFRVDFGRPDSKEQYLFHSEGWPLPFQKKVQVLVVTVGDLHLAAARHRWEDPHQ